MHCENTKNLKNAYVIYLSQQNYEKTGYKICWALTDNRQDKWNKLCENMGAKYLVGGSCTLAEGGCFMYKF